MTNPTPTPILPAEADDIFAYLPRRPLLNLTRGQYIPLEPAIYYVAAGCAAIKTTLANEKVHCAGIYFQGELFGNISDLPDGGAKERIGAARKDCSVMRWSAREITTIIAGQPRAAGLLLRVLGSNQRQTADRLRVTCDEKTMGRVVHLLYTNALRTGAELQPGRVMIPSLTHQLMAEYVGTSREIVTAAMNTLRAGKMITYTRKDTVIDTRKMGRRFALPGWSEEAKG